MGLLKNLRNITSGNDYGGCGTGAGVVAQVVGVSLTKGIIQSSRDKGGADPRTPLLIGGVAVWLAADGPKKRQPKKSLKCLVQKVASGVVIGTLTSSVPSINVSSIVGSS